MNISERHRHTSALICTVGRRLENQRRSLLTQWNIKNTEYSVLVALSTQGTTQTELATQIGVFRTHIGVIIKDLLEKELIAVTSPKEVTRNRTYALTPAGFQLQQKLQAEILRIDEQLFEGMTELELFQLEDTLERVQTRIPYILS